MFFLSMLSLGCRISLATIFILGFIVVRAITRKCEVCFFVQSIVTQFFAPITFQIPSSFTQVFITQGECYLVRGEQ